jgi:hypothetical protein
MATKFVSRQNVIVILGAVMIVCLALTIVTEAVALIWIGQPLGNAAGITADAFASVFSVAFSLRSLSRWPSNRAVSDHLEGPGVLRVLRALALGVRR